MNRRYKRNAPNIIINVAIYTFLGLLALSCALPLWHVLMSSFSNYAALSANTSFLFWPVGEIGLEGYKIVFAHDLIWRSYLNTVFYAASSTILGLILTYIGAYVLSQKNLLFGKFLMFIIVITMFFNAGVVPFFIVINMLELQNTMLSIILPTCCSAFNIILMRNGMSQVPEAMAEAAKIDGASDIRIMLKIYLPLTVSTLAVIAMFSIIGQWNSWFNASLFLSSEYENLYPLQLVVREILINGSMSGMSTGGIAIDFYKDLLNAVTVIVASAPILILYPFLQKYFERGFILGGVKG